MFLLVSLSPWLFRFPPFPSPSTHLFLSPALPSSRSLGLWPLSSVSSINNIWASHHPGHGRGWGATREGVDRLSMERRHQAAAGPVFGGGRGHSDRAEKGDTRRSQPQSQRPWLGRWAGGRGCAGSLKLPRRAGADPGPRATHLRIPSESSAQNPGKLPTPGTWTLPHHPCHPWPKHSRARPPALSA